jgi:hypothetical protein
MRIFGMWGGFSVGWALKVEAVFFVKSFIGMRNWKAVFGLFRNVARVTRECLKAAFSPNVLS